MAFLANDSQAGLLDESLALLGVLTAKSSVASPAPWWSEQSRLALHDELFRYFLALPRYATADAYTTKPRTALLQCLRPLGKSVTAPSKQPPLGRPCYLYQAEATRKRL